MAFLNEKFNTHTFCGGSKSGSAWGVCFFHASKIVSMVTAQAAHGVRKQNIEPRMAFLNEKFNTLTFCAGSKSESLWGVSFFVAWKRVHVVHSQLRNAWAPMVLGVRIPLGNGFQRVLVTYRFHGLDQALILLIDQVEYFLGTCRLGCRYHTWECVFTCNIDQCSREHAGHIEKNITIAIAIAGVF